MRFYDTDLTLLENMNNSVIALFILGVFLLVFVWVCHLTEKTEEKRNDVKTMFFYGIPTALIAIAISLALYPGIKAKMANVENENKEVHSQTEYQSATAKADCRLCGENPNDLLQFYYGEKNIAVLDLNTFDFYRLEINRYDDNKNLIEQSAGTLSSHTMRTQNGEMLDITTNSDRGFADGTITLNKNSKLSLDSLSSHLCSDCLTDIMNQYLYGDAHWNIAVLNLENKEITPLEDSVTGFTIGDFNIKVYEATDKKINFFAWYTPERYN